MLTFVPRSLAVLIAALSTACWVEPAHDDPRPSPPPANAYPAPAPSPSGSGSTTTPPANTIPLLVKVDPGRTLNAEPGQGVGIFVEAAGAGEWHVWWTCDTAKTNAPCAFDLRITGESGDLTSIESEGVLASDSIVATDARTIDARSDTGTNAVGVRFSTAPTGIIAIDALVGGVRDAGFFFFVQDGKPNGGYTGPLTNPLRFQAKTP